MFGRCLLIVSPHFVRNPYSWKSFPEDFTTSPMLLWLFVSVSLAKYELEEVFFSVFIFTSLKINVFFIHEWLLLYINYSLVMFAVLDTRRGMFVCVQLRRSRQVRGRRSPLVGEHRAGQSSLLPHEWHTRQAHPRERQRLGRWGVPLPHRLQEVAHSQHSGQPDGHRWVACSRVHHPTVKYFE